MSKKATRRRPTHNVNLIPANQEDVVWPFVGAAWQNRDGSLTIVLNKEIPKGSKIQIRARKS